MRSLDAIAIQCGVTLGLAAIIGIAAQPEAPKYVNIMPKRYCVLAVPPSHLARIPRLEAVYCTYGSTSTKCAVDDTPGWIYRVGSIVECD